MDIQTSILAASSGSWTLKLFCGPLPIRFASFLMFLYLPEKDLVTPLSTGVQHFIYDQFLEMTFSSQHLIQAVACS